MRTRFHPRFWNRLLGVAMMGGGVVFLCGAVQWAFWPPEGQVEPLAVLFGLVFGVFCVWFGSNQWRGIDPGW